MEERNLRLVSSVLCFVLSGICLYGSEFVVTKFNVVFQEDFNSFRGTLGTMPAGWVVSTNGSTILTTTNDFRGVDPGGVIPGGCYAWNVGTNAQGIDYALGVQPTADSFTPGFFMVVVSNATKAAIKEISLSYEVVCFNNADRSSSLDLEMSLDGISFVKINELAFLSPQTHSSNAVWDRSAYSCKMVLPRALKNEQCLWLRWYGDDSGGSGSRDEYGIDNFKILFHCISGTLLSIH